MKSNLMLSFKKGKIYTRDGVRYYRFLSMTTRYVFEVVEYHKQSERFITTHDLASLTANTAAQLVEFRDI